MRFSAIFYAIAASGLVAAQAPSEAPSAAPARPSGRPPVPSGAFSAHPKPSGAFSIPAHPSGSGRPPVPSGIRPSFSIRHSRSAPAVPKPTPEEGDDEE